MMNEKYKILVLKSLMFGYADIVKDQTKENSKNEQWYKQALEVRKYFLKIKPEPVSKTDRELLDKVYKKFVTFDAEYFQDKAGSPYLCMITILDYLVNEKRDTSLRVKFGHYPFKQIQQELGTMDELKKYYFDSEKYLSKILEKLEME